MYPFQVVAVTLEKFECDVLPDLLGLALKYRVEVLVIRERFIGMLFS